MGGSFDDEADHEAPLGGEFFVRTKVSSSTCSNKGGVEQPMTIREMVTCAVPNPKDIAERYRQVLNRTFQDVVRKASRTSKETSSDRAGHGEGLGALMEEVGQMLEGECEEHFQWEF